MIVWVLGGGGFIGRNLLSINLEGLNLIRIPQTQNDYSDLPSPNVVINLAASELNVSELASHKANIDYPLSILEEALNKCGQKLKWVQVGSYFEMQVPMGRHDFYSLHKLKFRELISNQSSSCLWFRLKK